MMLVQSDVCDEGASKYGAVHGPRTVDCLSCLTVGYRRAVAWAFLASGHRTSTASFLVPSELGLSHPLHSLSRNVMSSYML